jgi:hypothetical protein
MKTQQAGTDVNQNLYFFKKTPGDPLQDTRLPVIIGPEALYEARTIQAIYRSLSLQLWGTVANGIQVA